MIDKTINIYSTFQTKVISGGRYLVWILANNLANHGFKVNVIVDNTPIFTDFFERNENIKIIYAINNNFFNRALNKINYYFPFFKQINQKKIPSSNFSIIVPQIKKLHLHASMVSVARNTSDKIFLLNFETPNWFNSTSPKKKDKKHWVGWNYISKRCHVILSISKESQKWAKEYYYDLNSNLEYKYFYTNINSYIADLAPSYVSTKNTIICISRFDPHKGLDGLTELINENLSGCDLIIVLGSGSLSEEILNQFKNKSRCFNIRIIIKQSISEAEKFKLIKQSNVMIFPSFFEGFGMPPLEALYCNVPVVAFELPVLKEYAKENINFVKLGDYRALSVLCKKILLDKSKYKIDNNYINNIAKMGDLNNQLKNIFI